MPHGPAEPSRSEGRHGARRIVNGSATLVQVVLGLALGGAGVVWAGVILARAGDTIAARTPLGGLWFGLIFVALATSLPELLTAGISVRLGAPSMAAGDLFGSNMANMLILAIINLLPGAALFRRGALDQALAATHAISLTAIATSFILLSPPQLVGRIGPGSALLLVAWLAGARGIFRFSNLIRSQITTEELAEAAVGGAEGLEEPPRDAMPDKEAPPVEGPEGRSLGRPILQFVLGALLIAGTAPLFVASAQDAVEITGLGETFVGAVVLGVATSLPEFVASLAAIRIHAYDMAVANLFGSNALNMVIFLPLDLLHAPGPVLAAVEPVNIFAGLASIVMMSLALGAILFRAKRRFSMLEPSSALIMLVYVVAIAVMFGWGTAGIALP
jgi:cation:H+ antiporter